MILCKQSLVVLSCLLINACVFLQMVRAGWHLADGWEELDALLLIVSIGLGSVFSLSCVRKSDFCNRLIGAGGLIWFGLMLVWLLAPFAW